MSEVLEATAELYEAAAELDRPARCEVAGQHFRDNAVPRGTAQAWATRRRVLEALERLDQHVREHARRSVPEA